MTIYQMFREKLCRSFVQKLQNFIIAFHLFSGVFTEYLLKVPLTVVDEFHSHLEQLNQIPLHTFRKQVRLIRSLTNLLDNVRAAKTLIITMKMCSNSLFSFLFVHLTDFLQLCSRK